MAWTENASSSGHTHAGTDYEAWTFNEEAADYVEIECVVNELDDDVLLLVRASGSGKDGFLCGVDSGASTVMIKKVTDGGTPGSNLIGSPGSTSTMAANRPLTIRVRLVGTTITVSLLGYATNGDPVQVQGSATTSDYREQRRFAIVTDTDGAVVNATRLYTLEPILSKTQPILTVVSGGDVWTAEDPATPKKIATGAFQPRGPVSIAELRQKGYATDGPNKVVIDVVAETAEPMVATAGTLPSDFRSVIAAGFRLTWFGSPTQSQNFIKSNIRDALDYDTGKADVGRAYGAATDNASVGEPIVCILKGVQNEEIIACTTKTYRMIGDPALGIPPNIDEIDHQFGASGANSMVMTHRGLAVMHSPEGVVAIPSGGSPFPVSKGVLKTFLEIDPEDLDDYYISVAHDTRDQMLYFFFTPIVAGASPAVHIAYDLNLGRFEGREGQFWPIEFGTTDDDPTASGSYRGQTVVGSRGGKLYVFDPAAKSDHDDTAIDSYASCQTLVPPDTEGSVVMKSLAVTLGKDSDPVTCTVFGHETAQSVHDASSRRQLRQYTVRDLWKRMPARCRAPAMLVRLANGTLGEAMDLEAVQADVSTSVLRTRTRVAATVPAPGRDPGGDPDHPVETTEEVTLSTGAGNDSDPDDVVAVTDFWDDPFYDMLRAKYITDNLWGGANGYDAPLNDAEVEFEAGSLPSLPDADYPDNTLVWCWTDSTDDADSAYTSPPGGSLAGSLSMSSHASTDAVLIAVENDSGTWTAVAGGFIFADTGSNLSYPFYNSDGL